MVKVQTEAFPSKIELKDVLAMRNTPLRGSFFRSVVRQEEALPLPAGQTRQEGETNLDDGGEVCDQSAGGAVG